jgi:hypothetical protein
VFDISQHSCAIVLAMARNELNGARKITLPYTNYFQEAHNIDMLFN